MNCSVRPCQYSGIKRSQKNCSTSRIKYFEVSYAAMKLEYQKKPAGFISGRTTAIILTTRTLIYLCRGQNRHHSSKAPRVVKKLIHVRKSIAWQISSLFQCRSLLPQVSLRICFEKTLPVEDSFYMGWAHMLAYIAGTVDQKFLCPRTGYLPQKGIFLNNNTCLTIL